MISSRQIVVAYKPRFKMITQRQVIIPIEEQINEDLIDNPRWTIAHIVYINEGKDCTVVYNVEKDPAMFTNPSTQFKLKEEDLEIHVSEDVLQYVGKKPQ